MMTDETPDEALLRQAYAAAQAMEAAYQASEQELATARAENEQLRADLSHAQAAVRTAQEMYERLTPADTLLEQMDACWEIVRAVAGTDGTPYGAARICPFCEAASFRRDKKPAHAADCAVTQARALLETAKA